MLVKTFAAAFLIFLSTAIAQAKDLGTVEFEGRQIVLSDDGTWTYADGANKNSDASATKTDDCIKFESKTVPLTICLAEGTWSLGQKFATAEFAFQTSDQEVIALVITEKAKMTLAELGKAIISNAQSASGLKPITVKERDPITVGGHEFQHLEYEADIDDLNFTYHNYYANDVGENGLVQVIVFSQTSGAERLEPLARGLVEAITVGG